MSGAPSRAASRTVEELRARLRSPRSVVRADDYDSAPVTSPTTIFDTGPDGGCVTWLRERGVDFHRQRFASEAAAVADAEGRILQTRAQPGSERRLTGPPAATVEELKAAMAGVGRDPDGVARAEGLREAPKVEGMQVFEQRDDGSVRTYTLERGAERNEEAYPDEAAAVAVAYRHLVEHDGGRWVSDLDVERMRARVSAR